MTVKSIRLSLILGSSLHYLLHLISVWCLCIWQLSPSHCLGLVPDSTSRSSLKYSCPLPGWFTLIEVREEINMFLSYKVCAVKTWVLSFLLVSYQKENWQVGSCQSFFLVWHRLYNAIYCFSQPVSLRDLVALSSGCGAILLTMTKVLKDVYLWHAPRITSGDVNMRCVSFLDDVSIIYKRI